MHKNENWSIPSTPCYVVKNNGEYLQILYTQAEAEASGDAQKIAVKAFGHQHSIGVRWTDNSALASRWVGGNSARVHMWRLNNGAVVPNGAWAVGLDVAAEIMETVGGRLVHVRAKTSRLDNVLITG